MKKYMAEIPVIKRRNPYRALTVFLVMVLLPLFSCTTKKAGNGGDDDITRFAPGIQVNDDPGNLMDEREPVVAVADNGSVYIVWHSVNVESIFFSRSIDGGKTFSQAVRINDNATYPPSFKAYGADISLDAGGNIYVVWFDYRGWPADDSYTSPIDVYMDKSSDGGLTWSSDVKVSFGSGYYPWNFQPRIAIDKTTGYIYVAYNDYNRYWPEGDAGDVSVARSVDGGLSFEPQVRVDDSGGTAEQTWPSIAVDPTTSDVYVAFSDSRNGNKDVYAARSADGGQNFGANVRVNDFTSNDQEEPSIALDVSGVIYVVWKDWRDDQDPQNEPYLNDIYVAKSVDQGIVYSPSVRVTDENMNARYGYVFPPRVAADNSGSVHVVWHDRRSGVSTCYYDRSLDGAQTFSQDGIVAEESTAFSDLLPRIAVDPSGKVLLTWMDLRNGNDNYDIYFATSE